VVATRRGLITAPEVSELLSEDDLDTLHRQAVTGYRCLICQQNGDLAAGPAAVVVRIGPAPGEGPDGAQVAHVRLAHRGCARSGVVDTPTTSLAPPAEAGMTATAAVIPGAGGGLRALLIIEPSAQMSSVAGPGERGNPILDRMLTDGLHLLPRLADAPPHSPGWLLRLPTRWKAAVLGPDGETYYAGELEQPRVWRQLTRRRRSAELLAGNIGLRFPITSAEECPALLDGAAHAGRLAGGTIGLR